MKKIILILLIVTVKISSIFAAPIVFADPAFKAKLISSSVSNLVAQGVSNNNIIVDINGDGEIDDITEAPLVYSIYIQGTFYAYQTITNLTGIEKFTNLEKLDCTYGHVNTLPIALLTNLEYLLVDHNDLTSLNCPYHPNLYRVWCNDNQITTLDVSNCPNLYELACEENLINNLNFQNCPLLYDVDARTNLLTSIYVGSLPNLHQLTLIDNQLNYINLGSLPNLQIFSIANNQMTYVNNLFYQMPALTSLWVENNLMTNVDISLLPLLTILDCRNNSTLTSLNLKNGANEFVHFSGCANLHSICVDETQMNSIESSIISNGYTTCFASPYCTLNAVGSNNLIYGQSAYSDIGSCVTSSIPIPYMKYAVTDGTLSTNIWGSVLGNYGIPVSDGTFSITPELEHPSYFYVSPTSASIPISAATSPAYQEFCVMPSGVFDDLEIALLPLFSARPGFQTFYKLIIKNNGTSTQSGTATLNYDASKLSYVSSSTPYTSNPLNQFIWNISGLLPFETREILIRLQVATPPTVVSGTLLHFTSVINSSLTDVTPANNTFSLDQRAVNSHDPNDKTCLEGPTILTTEVGDYVHYVIRFENTGTFAAQNIVVRDLIDLSNFDINTLIPLSASHSFTTRISNGNLVEFIFENIFLPFASGSNDGYIAFKIKTLPTLTAGQTFTNLAKIYFDFNSPIITNTSSTLIKAPFALPITLINFSSKAIPSNQVQLDWETTNEINFKEFDIERSVDGIHFDKIGLVENNATHDYSFVDIKPNSKNYYRLKLVDLDGQFDYSKVEMLELQHDNAMTFFPNPVSSELTLSFSSSSTIYKSEISIKNTMGQEVLHENIEPNTLQHRIKVQCLPIGIYFIELKNKNFTEHLTFSKK